MDEMDIPALIAELRGFAAGSESARASLMRDAADALERLARKQALRELIRDGYEYSEGDD